jgi:DNA-binding NarL/FixJ family response regulator
MKPLRILLVDDHQVVLTGLRTILESQESWQVCGEATTGREAVEKAKQLKPDVVVMDFKLPEMNGVEATRQIRQSLPNTEVLILTMHESGTLAEEALAAGARGFVLKTDANNQLVAAVKKLANHRLGYTKKAEDMVLEAAQRNSSPSAPAAATDQLLTSREREIIRLIAAGKRSKDIATELDISVKTAESHRNSVMRKLNMHSATELVRYAIRNKLVEP